jgi:hypothetical protein
MIIFSLLLKKSDLAETWHGSVFLPLQGTAFKGQEKPKKIPGIFRFRGQGIHPGQRPRQMPSSGLLAHSFDNPA